MKTNAQVDEMRDRLIDFYTQDPSEHLGDALLRRMEDPLKPRNEHGSFRVNPIVLFLATVFVLALGTFLAFSFVQL